MTDSEMVQLLVQTSQDLDWYKKKMDFLKEKYLHKFIAIANASVLEADEDLDGLFNKLQQKGIDRSSVLVKFVTNLRAILSFDAYE